MGLNNWCFIRNKTKLKEIDTKDATSALQKLLKHPSYFVKKILCTPFFSKSKKVSDSEKAPIVENYQQ